MKINRLFLTTCLVLLITILPLTASPYLVKEIINPFTPNTEIEYKPIDWGSIPIYSRICGVSEVHYECKIAEVNTFGTIEECDYNHDGRIDEIISYFCDRDSSIYFSKHKTNNHLMVCFYDPYPCPYPYDDCETNCGRIY